MSSTKITGKGLVSFAELQKRCQKNQIHLLNKLRDQRRKYQERLEKLERGVPSIDWDYYKRNVRSECVTLVEDFEKKYESFSVPYPEDNFSKQIENVKAVVEKDLIEFIRKSNERIAAYEKEIERIHSMMPYEEMTWEEFCILCPEKAPDFINRPTFWPHSPEEQIGYVENADEETSMKRKK